MCKQGNILSVALQEGFADDTVALYLDGQEVFRKEHLTTHPFLGVADSIALQVEDRTALLEITVESRGLSKSMPLEITRDTYIGVSLVEGDLDTFVSKEAFGYA